MLLGKEVISMLKTTFANSTVTKGEKKLYVAQYFASITLSFLNCHVCLDRPQKYQIQ